MTHARPIRTAAGALALAAALTLSVAVEPLAAQSDTGQSDTGQSDNGQSDNGQSDNGQTANPDLAEGAEMLSEGFKKLFRGLMGELEPAGEAAEKGWNDLVDWLGDLSAFEAPEQLPNGDILIRRKEPLAPGTDL